MKKKLPIVVIILIFTTLVYMWTRPPECVRINKVLFHAKEGSSGDYEIYIMNPDGSNIKQLTHNKGDDQNARFSPDGQKIVFEKYSTKLLSKDSEGFIYTMDVDGSNLKKLYKGIEPAWSPDGTQIAFIHNNDLAIMNSDGSGYKQILESGEKQMVDSYGSPNWLPDRFPVGDLVYIVRYDGGVHIEKVNLGFKLRSKLESIEARLRVSLDGKIAFMQADALYVRNVIGRVKTVMKLEDYWMVNYPIFSPDGKKIMCAYDQKGVYEIWTINLDGSNKQQVVNVGVDAVPTDWR